MKDLIQKFIDDEDGLTIVEYAVAGGLISVAAIAAFLALGGKVQGVIQGISDDLPTP